MCRSSQLGCVYAMLSIISLCLCADCWRASSIIIMSRVPSAANYSRAALACMVRAPCNREYDPISTASSSLQPAAAGSGDESSSSSIDWSQSSGDDDPVIVSTTFQSALYFPSQRRTAIVMRGSQLMGLTAFGLLATASFRSWRHRSYLRRHQTARRAVAATTNIATTVTPSSSSSSSSSPSLIWHAGNATALTGALLASAALGFTTFVMTYAFVQGTHIDHHLDVMQPQVDRWRCAYRCVC